MTAGSPVTVSRLRLDATRALSRLDTRRGAVLLFAVALASYWVQAIAWPLQRGRDSWDYWLYFLQLLDSQPPFSALQVFRTPVTPLVVGAPMQIGGAQLLEIVLSVLYAASMVGWVWAARPFGRVAAFAVAVALLLHLPYAALFHQVSSDGVFAAVLAGWTGLAVRAAFSPSRGRLVVLGLGVAVLTLTRPAGQVLAASVLLVPLVSGGGLRARIGRAGVMGVAVALPLALWAGHNAARYDDFTVARGGKAWVPFFKVFGQIDPSDGPASARLAGAIEREVLTQPPFRRYGVDIRTYLDGSSNFESIRMIALSDRVFGWSSGYDVLFDAAMERIREHPGAYADDVATTFRRFVTQRYAFDTVERLPSYPEPAATVEVAGKPLPNPAAISPLVEAARYGFVWCPTDDIDRCILPDPAVAFGSTAEQDRYRELTQHVRAWNAELPLRDSYAPLARRLGTISWNTPRSFVWIAIAAAALALRRPRGSSVLLVLMALAALVLLVHALSQSPQNEFALPAAPVFVLAAVAALAAPRRGDAGSGRDAVPSPG